MIRKIGFYRFLWDEDRAESGRSLTHVLRFLGFAACRFSFSPPSIGVLSHGVGSHVLGLNSVFLSLRKFDWIENLRVCCMASGTKWAQFRTFGASEMGQNYLGVRGAKLSSIEPRRKPSTRTRVGVRSAGGVRGDWPLVLRLQYPKRATIIRVSMPAGNVICERCRCYPRE